MWKWATKRVWEPVDEQLLSSFIFRVGGIFHLTAALYAYRRQRTTVFFPLTHCRHISLYGINMHYSFKQHTLHQTTYLWFCNIDYWKADCDCTDMIMDLLTPQINTIILNWLYFHSAVLIEKFFPDTFYRNAINSSKI